MVQLQILWQMYLSDNANDGATASEISSDPSSLTDGTPNLQVLLASAMNIVSDNDAVKDMIAEVLNATAEFW